MKCPGRFHIQRHKESTGRVVFWAMGIMCSYTMEASYGGTNMGSRAFTHFNTEDYEGVGRYFCETLLDHQVRFCRFILIIQGNCYKGDKFHL